jgi:hypothetical protein
LIVGVGALLAVGQQDLPQLRLVLFLLELGQVEAHLVGRVAQLVVELVEPLVHLLAESLVLGALDLALGHVEGDVLLVVLEGEAIDLGLEVLELLQGREAGFAALAQGGQQAGGDPADGGLEDLVDAPLRRFDGVHGRACSRSDTPMGSSSLMLGSTMSL